MIWLASGPNDVSIAQELPTIHPGETMLICLTRGWQGALPARTGEKHERLVGGRRVGAGNAGDQKQEKQPVAHGFLRSMTKGKDETVQRELQSVISAIDQKQDQAAALEQIVDTKACGHPAKAGGSSSAQSEREAWVRPEEEGEHERSEQR